MPMHYSSSPFRANNIITGTNNTYPIYLSGVPKGNGTYQQLITIKDPSKYGINANGSNIAFYDGSNQTELYAWEQNINSTAIQVWVKNYNGSSTIDMRVLPFNKNLFNATGYLGEAPQLSSTYAEYDNGRYVFSYYWNFSGTSLPSGWNANGVNYNVSNGLYLSYTASYAYISTAQILSINNEILANIEIGNGGEGRFVENNYTAWSIESQQTVVGYGSTWGLDEYNGVGGNDVGIPKSSGYNTYGLYVNDTDAFLNYLGEKYVASLGYDYNSSNKFFIGLGGNNPNQYENISYIAVPTLSLLYMPTFTIGTSLYHSIDFKLIGSSTSFQWSISINGTIYNATSSNIYLNMTNGYYNIIVNLPSQYSAIANGILKVNNANEIFRITVVSQSSNNFSNDIMYAIILASIIIAVALYFSRRN